MRWIIPLLLGTPVSLRIVAAALAIAALADNVRAQGEVVASWDMMGQLGNQAETLGIGTAQVTALPITRGSTLIPQVGSSSMSSSGWVGGSTEPATKHYSFGVLVNGGYSLGLQRLRIATRATSSGPSTLALRYNLDGFASDLAVWVMPQASTVFPVDIDLSGIPPVNGVVEFRIVSKSETSVTGGQVTSSATVRLFNFTDGVTTSPIQLLGFISPSSLPFISSFSPLSGAAGTVVTVNGGNFATNSSLRFNGVNAPIISANDTQIVARVPADAVSGLLSVTTAVQPAATSFAPFSVTESLETAAMKPPRSLESIASWSANGTPWLIDASTHHDGIDSIKAQTTNGQSTYREYTVTGPAVVDFWWKVSSEQSYDTFSYSVNAVNQETISGEVDWTYRTLTLPQGTHTIRWTYAKDGSDAVGQDAGWLNDFAVYPATATLQLRDGATVLSGTTTVDFGSADLGSAGFTKSLTFVNTGYIPLEVQLSLPEGSPFTFDGGAATSGLFLGRGESVGVPIRLAATAAGTKSAQLTISTPDSTTAPPSITFTGYVAGQQIAVKVGGLRLVSGETFDMGLAPQTTEFTITNDGVVDDLLVSGMSIDGGIFQILPVFLAPIPPGGSLKFKMFSRAILQGRQSATLQITSNAANTETFVIPLVSKALFAGVEDITSVRSFGDYGAAGWDFAATLLPDGTTGNALKTGATPDSGQSHLQATVAEAGLLTWRWKLSAQEGFDWLACEVSGGPSPTVYQDTTGDAEAFSANGILDIVDMEVAENATDLVFTLTVNGDIGLMQSISAEFYVGIANGKSAGTASDNPWFKPISLTSPVGGMTHWLGSWVSSTDSGGGRGALLYSYNGGQWSTSPTEVGLEVTTGTRSVLRYTVSKASLHFERGDVLYFDFWSGLGYPTTSALDALSNPRPAVSVWGDPYQSSPTTGISRYPRGGEVTSISTKSAIWREQTVYVPANGIVKWTYRKDGSAAVGEDAGYITDLSFQPFTTPQTTYGDWWTSFGRPTPPAPKTPMATSGLPAIISWVGGFDPDTAPDAGLYRLLNESGQWKLRFPISKTYGGGSVSAEFSSALTNGWSGAGVRQTLHSQDADTVIIEATPPAGATKGFMRLNVR